MTTITRERPTKERTLTKRPIVFHFKPVGIPSQMLIETIIKADELETIKLHTNDDLSQREAAKKMKISQPTFARILNRARKKIARALIFGQAIKIEAVPKND